MKEDKYIVYLHTVNTKDGEKYYVGSTGLSQNKRYQNGYGYQNLYFFTAIVKYGWDNIEHKILHKNLTKECAEKLEQEEIIKYKSYDTKYGYNCCIENHASGINNPYSKQIKCLETNIAYGSIRECCRKLNLNNGVLRTHLKNKKGSLKGLHFVYLEDCKTTIEDIENNTCRSCCKKVKCLETDKEYLSNRECSKDMNISESQISQCARGKIKKANGFTFVYIN